MQTCLNTSTIRERIEDLGQAVELCAAAGYDGIEPWASEINAWQAAGGSLPELRRHIADAGLAVPNIIAFPHWCVEDPQQRAAGLREVERCCRLAAALDCPRLAMPPAGITAAAPVSLAAMCERYRMVCELSARYGVIAMLEFWGKAPQLATLAESQAVLAGARHPDGCLLLDIFHMYMGGSRLESIRRCPPGSIGLVHVNDYPYDCTPETGSDADRVLPGAGVADWPGIIASLQAAGYDGMLSLELFNRELWAEDPASVARRGRAALQDILSEAGRGQEELRP